MDNGFSTIDLKKFKVFKELIRNKKVPTQLLISSNKIEKLNNFSLFLVKFLVCKKNCEFNCDCFNCIRIANNLFYDLKVYGDFKTSVKKNDVQEIIHTFNYSSLEDSGIKVYIINGIDLLTLDAVNSLLKFLEEPPKNTYAFLLTTNRSKVIDTIKSRCLNIMLSNVSEEIKLDLSKTEIIQDFFYNLQNGQENNFILAREINNFSPNECQEIFLKIAEVIQEKKWFNYNIVDQIIIKKLTEKMVGIIEICFQTSNLLFENFSKELVIEKAMLDFYNIL